MFYLFVVGWTFPPNPSAGHLVSWIEAEVLSSKPENALCSLCQNLKPVDHTRLAGSMGEQGRESERDRETQKPGELQRG